MVSMAGRLKNTSAAGGLGGITISTNGTENGLGDAVTIFRFLASDGESATSSLDSNDAIRSERLFSDFTYESADPLSSCSVILTLTR